MCGNAILDLGEIAAMYLVGLRQEDRLAWLRGEELENPLAMVRIEAAERRVDDQGHGTLCRIGDCRNQRHSEDLTLAGGKIEVVNDAAMTIDQRDGTLWIDGHMVDHGLVGERAVGTRDRLGKVLETDWSNLFDHLFQFSSCLHCCLGSMPARFTNPAAIAPGLELVGDLQALVFQTTERSVESSTLPLKAGNLIRYRLEIFAQFELAAIVRVTKPYCGFDLIIRGLLTNHR